MLRVVFKKTQNQTRTGSLLKITKVDGLGWVAVVGSFLCKYFSLLKYQRFHLLFELYHCNEKLSFFFSHLKASITHVSVSSIILFFFFCLGFLSRTFTIHRTVGKGWGYFFNPPYHFHPLYRRLNISRAITAESSPLHIASSWTQTGNCWISERKLLTTKQRVILIIACIWKIIYYFSLFILPKQFNLIDLLCCDKFH